MITVEFLAFELTVIVLLNVPGIFVPERIIDKMAKTTDKVSMCLEILSELITRIKPYCAGVHIQALGWEKHVPKLIKDLGL